ncbi:amidohydrolase, partial [Leucobacter sp. M11]|uniref:amidohydrolase n=1 Tax=Leucobacter sp. M11 TaxID=2993565 RepID=UPI002D80CA6E
SWAEHETAAHLAEVLRAAGLTPVPFAERSAPDGSVPDYPGFTVDVGPGEPLIGLRADLDGLVHETPEGTVLAHSCGHDANLAVVTETMLRLAELGPRLRHGVRAIFQPAEERGNGAESVAALGVTDRLRGLLGVHLRPGTELPAPRFTPAISHGACLFARGVVTGPDVHGARPHLGVNAVEVLAELTQAVAALRVDPQVPASAKLTHVSAGGENLNVIPGSASFGLDLRAQSNEAMARLRDGVERIAASLADRHGVGLELAFEDHVPAAVIGPEAEALLARSIAQVAGPDALAPRSITSGSDDFHCYTLRDPALPAAMLGIGADVSPGLHDPAMRYDRSRLDPAAAVLVAACLAAEDLPER